MTCIKRRQLGGAICPELSENSSVLDFMPKMLPISPAARQIVPQSDHNALECCECNAGRKQFPKILGALTSGVQMCFGVYYPYTVNYTRPVRRECQTVPCGAARRKELPVRECV
jgi:hypothetical protein